MYGEETRSVREKYRKKGWENRSRETDRTSETTIDDMEKKARGWETTGKWELRGRNSQQKCGLERMRERMWITNNNQTNVLYIKVDCYYLCLIHFRKENKETTVRKWCHQFTADCIWDNETYHIPPMFHNIKRKYKQINVQHMEWRSVKDYLPVTVLPCCVLLLNPKI